LDQPGVAVIPKAGQPESQKANLAALDIRLDDEDRAAIAALPKDQRFVRPPFAPDWEAVERNLPADRIWGTISMEVESEVALVRLEAAYPGRKPNVHYHYIDARTQTVSKPPRAVRRVPTPKGPESGRQELTTRRTRRMLGIPFSACAVRA
jgi:hypothetical protein